jgi:hypothetical protein
MRTVHWMLVVSVTLFVSGIGFVIAGARATRTAVPIEERLVMTPVASVRQICAGIVWPAATVVYNAVGTIIDIDGITEIAPQNDEEWAVVANSAAALAESGNLFLLGDRAVDDGDWVTISRALIEAGTTALHAAEAQDIEGILAIGGEINATCDNCHAQYQRQ